MGAERGSCLRWREHSFTALWRIFTFSATLQTNYLKKKKKKLYYCWVDKGGRHFCLGTKVTQEERNRLAFPLCVCFFLS